MFLELRTKDGHILITLKAGKPKKKKEKEKKTLLFISSHKHQGTLFKYYPHFFFLFLFIWMKIIALRERDGIDVDSERTYFCPQNVELNHWWDHPFAQLFKCPLSSSIFFYVSWSAKESIHYMFLYLLQSQPVIF